MILIAVSVVRSTSVEVLALLDDATLELLDDLLLLVLRSSPSEPVQELVPRRSALWPSTSTSLIAPSLASLSASAGSTWCCHRNASAGGDLSAMGNRAAADIGRLRFVGTGKQSLRDAHQICVLHLNMATEASLPPICPATILVRTPVARCHGNY